MKDCVQLDNITIKIMHDEILQLIPTMPNNIRNN